MNLLERMAEALRHEHEGNKDALASLMERGIYDGVDDDAKRQMDEVDALLAEFERDKERLVTLTLKPISELPQEMETGFCVLLGDGPGLYVAKPQGFLLENAYAFAPLPPVPGPEVFK